MAEITYAERDRIFGKPGNQANLVLITTPWGLKARVHRLVAERFLAGLTLAGTRSGWAPRRIDSYAYRPVRGKRAMSLHSYGLALDLFDLPYPQTPDIWGPTNAPDRVFLDAFRDLGFRVGADYRGRKDYPHVEWIGAMPRSEPVRVAGTKVEQTNPQPVGGPATTRPPQTTVVAEEVVGVTVSTLFVDWKELDDQGRGWVIVGFPMERVLSVIGQGSNPSADGYWAPIVATLQPHGAETLVTLAGAPRQGGGVYVKVLEEA